MQPILLCKLIFATTLIFSVAIVTPVQSAKTPLNVSNLEPTTSPSPSLSPDDCSKCHNNIVVELALNGAAHYSKITCIDCHGGHPPSKRDIIPRCSKCHKKEPHFLLKNCSYCHTNPHTPLQITLSRNITKACTTCHTEQIKQLKEYPSIHTTLDCTACHTKHGLIPECFACHGPHSSGMTNQNCLSCHKAHMPLEISYGENIPSEHCGSCHQRAYNQLGKSLAKHRAVACVKCHSAKHKMIPECQNCHIQPHSPSIIDKFSGCRTCHNIAHDLQINTNETFMDNN